MRKSLLLCTLLTAALQTTFAQDQPAPAPAPDVVPAARQAYSKGDLTLSLGTSLNYLGNGWSRSSGQRTGLPLPIILNADYGVHEIISVGGFASFYRSGLENSVFQSHRTVSMSGVRATFHLTEFLNEKACTRLDPRKLDIYFGALAGFSVSRYSNEWEPPFEPDRTSNTNVRLLKSTVAGLRYFVKPRVGLYVEGGSGQAGRLNFGVTMRL